MQPPVVVLVGTQHPGNVGASARAAANFGAVALRFVAPRCDVKSKEALDRAVHAKPLLEAATIHATLADALRGTSLSVGTTARSAEAPNRFQRKPLDIRDWMADLAKANWDGQIAYVFGPEDAGLSTEDVNLLDQLVTIPTAEYWSLNLSHAVNLVCYEHFRLTAAGVTPPRTLQPDALTTLHKAWDDLSLAVESRPWRRDNANAVWRKILGRSLPDTYEVHNLMGILANTLKRFGHADYATETSEKILAERGLKVD